MKRYIYNRLLMLLPVLFGISILAFVLGVVSPGDPAEFALNQNGLDAPTEAQILAMRVELGLDKPIYMQYIHWLLQLFHGNLGNSYITGKDIISELLVRIPVTLKLASVALIFATGMGISLGVLCSVYKESYLDKIILFINNIILAVPGFWLALLMILIFSELLKVLPTSGSETWRHFIMPAITISLSTAAAICSYTRSALLKEFGKQYFIVAKLRGIKPYKLLLFYALPNSLPPIIALLGNYWASVLGGSVIAESIFAIPGISSMALEAINMRDYPVLQAYVLITGCIMVIMTLLVDILMFYFNPKIRGGVR